MGTLYNCLREARLEKYYPSLVANGITRSEALATLTMTEFTAIGVSGTEDKRRLMELIGIIKSVHRASNNNNVGLPRKRQPSPNALRQAQSISNSNSTYSTSQSDKKVPRRHAQSPTDSLSGVRLTPPRDVSVRERVPNFSAASYMEMLEIMSDSSQSEHSEQLSHSSDSDAIFLPSRATAPAQSPIGKVPKRMSAVERAKPTKSKGYNYGVPSSKDTSRSKVKSSQKPSRGDERIRVCVRKRPLNRREIKSSDADVVDAESTTTVVVKEPKVAVDLTAFTLKHEFIFDEVFDEKCSNEDVYVRAARPLISTVFRGSNATFFAYGQTGAGKTHTMIGDRGVPGLYQLAAEDMFNIIASGQYGTNLHVWVSFFEIYCGQLFDLLNRRSRLVPREDGSHHVCIAGLTETEAPNVETLIKVLDYGNSVRSKGVTGVNPDSSRSHAILQLEVRDAEENKLGKLSFIDLAGSERAADMMDTDRQTRLEGAEINQSLLALKECIRSIDQESRHTPFRQSKLTHILKDSFVGKSRTCMIANISPSQSACEHTLNTLRYADRVKELRRESGPGGSGTSVGQAMNLLMNIPLTAPSIFHPSNVLSTSTPVRPQSIRSHQAAPSSAAEVMFDPSETPIRGHNVHPKPTHRGLFRLQPAGPSTVSGPLPSKLRWQDTWRPRSGSPLEAAASQAAPLPHPEASPSESEQTDTDSCNVTHLTETRPGPSQPNIPVIRSTDTEFDFPTSDFNNLDDHLNDLNRAGGKGKGDTVIGGLRVAEDHIGAAAGSVKAGQAVQNESQRVMPGGPAYQASLTSVNQFPPQQSIHNGGNRSSISPNSSSTQTQVAGRGKIPKALSPNSLRTSYVKDIPPSSNVAITKTASLVMVTQTPGQFSNPPLTESFDDELLFMAPVSTAAQMISYVSPALETSSTQSVVRENTATPTSLVSKLSKHIRNALPAVQPAQSSDLTSFSQRSPMRAELDKVPVTHSPTMPLQHEQPSISDRQNNDFRLREVSNIATSVEKNHLFIDEDDRCEVVSHRSDPVPVEHGVSSYRSSSSDSILLKRNSLKLAMESTSEGGLSQESASVNTLNSSPHSKRNISEQAFASISQSPHSVETELRTGNNGLTSVPHAFANEVSDHSDQKLTSSLGSGDILSIHLGSNVLLTTPTNGHPKTHSNIAEIRSGINGAQNPSLTSFSSSRHVIGSAVVTEKLWSGAVFSPIHPQPVTTTVTRSSAGVNMTQVKSLTSVPAYFPSTNTTPVLTTQYSDSERNQARVNLVAAHEDQLASITSLCKQEMKLLLNAKKSGHRSFEDYILRISNILAQKMTAMQLLQQQIKDYQTHFLSPQARVTCFSRGSDSEIGLASQTH